MRNFLLKVLVIFFLFGTGAGFSAEKPSEYQIKAAYLYNFAKFIKWPENTFKNNASPIIVGILGENTMTAHLIPLSLRKVRNHPIKIRHINSLKEAHGCQLLYIDIEKPDQLIQILDALKSTPIVTIGDYKDFASGGGIIQFVTIRERLRFIINHDTARKNKIQIDAQLLSLAIDVLEEN